MEQYNPSQAETSFISTLEIHDVLLTEASHKVSKLYEEGSQLTIALAHDKLGILVTETIVAFEIDFKLKIFNQNDENQENILIDSSAKFGAIYTYENLDGWEEGQVEQFAATFYRFSAITHITAFARQHFYSLITNSGYPRLQLPLIKSLLDKEAENVASDSLSTTEE